jgi:hypothetical protein
MFYLVIDRRDLKSWGGICLTDGSCGKACGIFNFEGFWGLADKGFKVDGKKQPRVKPRGVPEAEPSVLEPQHADRQESNP